jgi:hypothetical protein
MVFCAVFEATEVWLWLFVENAVKHQVPGASPVITVEAPGAGTVTACGVVALQSLYSIRVPVRAPEPVAGIAVPSVFCVGFVQLTVASAP